MWACANCSKDIEDDEPACYHCGCARAQTAADFLAQTQQAAEIDAFDRAHDLDLTTWTRDYRKLLHGRTLAYFLALTLVGAALVIDGVVDLVQDHRYSADNIIYVAGAIWMVIGAACLGTVVTGVNRTTKVHPLKHPPVPAVRTAGD